MISIKELAAQLTKKTYSYFKHGNIYLNFILLTTLFFTLCSSGFGQDKKVVHPQANGGYPKCNFYISCPYKTYLGAFECGYIPPQPYNRDDLVKLGFNIGYPCYKLVISSHDSYYKTCSKYDQTVIRTIIVWDDRNYNGYFDYGERGVKCYLYYKLVADVTPPTIYCPKDTTVSCYNNVPAADPYSVKAYDNCTKYPHVYFVGDKIYGYGCSRYIIRVYKAVDDCYNISYCYQKIYIVDKIPPTIYCPKDTTVSCYKDVPAADPYSVTAYDNCGGKVYVYFVGDVTYGYGCSRYIIRTYKAVDECYNISYCYQKIYIVDKTPPTITYCPPSIYIGCYDYVPYPNPYLVQAYDNCGGTVHTYFVGDKTYGYGCPRYIIRTYKVVDECYNVAYCYQTIYVGYSDVTTKATQSGTESMKGAQVQGTTTALGVKAYPNPFRDKVQFQISSPVSGKGKLEVFSLLGQKLATVWEGNVTAGKTQSVDYTAPVANRTNLVYRFSVGDKVVTGKLLNIK